MIIDSFDDYQYSLDLSQPLILHEQAHQKREGLILHLKSNNGAEGFGEVSPLPGFSDETLAEAKGQVQILQLNLCGEEISEKLNDEKDFSHKRLYSSSRKSNISKPINSTRNVNYIPWSIGALVFIILFILIYLYYPFYEVEAGNIVTCKRCGKEITNTVHTVKASLLNKDDYNISYGKDYCQKCGNELVPYKVRIRCSNCNKVYATRTETAPRRLEQSDKYITEGYCSNSCKILGETKDLLNEGQEVIEGLFDNFIF